MITAASRPRMPSVRLLALATAAVVVLVVALGLRGSGPAPLPLPEMAPAAVILPDGSSLHVQRYEVTIEEWNTCFRQGGCAVELRARPHHEAGSTPATGLSFVDVQDYLRWINAATGQEFRLPSIAEWNHMAQPVLPAAPDPVFTDPTLTWASAYLTEGSAPRALKVQGSFSTTTEGISDLDGSVWEWTQDCYAGTGDGSALADCTAFFVGGVHVAAMFYMERDPARGGCAAGTPPAHLGLRLVSETPV